MEDQPEQESQSQRDEITDEVIARRAWEISQSEDAGTDDENWLRAERELRSPEPSE